MVGPLILILFIEGYDLFKIFFRQNGQKKSNGGSGKSRKIKKPDNKDSGSNNMENQNNNSNQNNNNELYYKDQILPLEIRVLLFLVIASGLLFLSMAPHQEARFLLPLFFPLSLLSFRYFYFNQMSSRTLMVIWILFNMFATLFFGFVHQGGVVPSLIYLQKKIHNTNNNIQLQYQQQQQQPLLQQQQQQFNIIYYHTYMPPRHFLGVNQNQTNVHIYDLGGRDISFLVTLLEQLSDANSETLILSPMKSILYQQYKNKTCQLIESFWPHLTTEDPPNSIDELRLYLLSCNVI
eukprot:gene7613-9364_t